MSESYVQLCVIFLVQKVEDYWYLDAQYDKQSFHSNRPPVSSSSFTVVTTAQKAPIGSSAENTVWWIGLKSVWQLRKVIEASIAETGWRCDSTAWERILTLVVMMQLFHRTTILRSPEFKTKKRQILIITALTYLHYIWMSVNALALIHFVWICLKNHLHFSLPHITAQFHSFKHVCTNTQFHLG